MFLTMGYAELSRRMLSPALYLDKSGHHESHHEKSRGFEVCSANDTLKQRGLHEVESVPRKRSCLLHTFSLADSK